MYFTDGSDRAFEKLMRTAPGSIIEMIVHQKEMFVIAVIFTDRFGRTDIAYIVYAHSNPDEERLKRNKDRGEKAEI